MKELELSKKGKNKGKYFALVDDDVYDEVNKYNWHYSYTRDKNDGYARNTKMNIYLHVYIWKLKNGDIPKGLEIEHKDENKLNCQLSNLRLASSSENHCNITKRKNNTSGVKGISKHAYKKFLKNGTEKEYTYWRARVTKDHKDYTKKFSFTDEGFEQAKEWIKNMSLEIQGEYSIYNKPDENK